MEAPPLGRLVQTLATVVFLATTVTVAVAFVRHRRHLTLLAAVGVGAIMTCAYTTMLFMRSIHPDDARCAAWVAVSTLVLAALLLVPACTRVALLTVGVAAVCLTSAVLMIRTAQTATHSRLWSGCALVAYLGFVATVAWSLRTVACPQKCLPVLRLMLALWGLYPPVYLAETRNIRDAWFTLLDTAVVVGFCWGMRRAVL